MARIIKAIIMVAFRPICPKAVNLFCMHSSNLITQPPKKKTPDEHASHVDGLRDRLPREQLCCTGFTDW